MPLNTTVILPKRQQLLQPYNRLYEGPVSMSQEKLGYEYLLLPFAVIQLGKQGPPNFYSLRKCSRLFLTG